jgi:flagellum-specific peptidoglycan hydrolase FlgJ
MKEFDAPDNTGKNSTMRVIAKKGQTMDVARHEFSQDTASIPLESFAEKAQRLLRGMQIWQAAIQHQLDRWTYGGFSKFKGMTLVKVFILAIIMFQIFRSDVADVENTVIFAAGNGNIKEKTRIDKQKQRPNNTTAAVNNGVSFDLSPAAVEELKAPNVKAYIESFSRASIAEMDKFGIPASITMAQAIIESRSGTSVLAVRHNNHFGIKCFSKSCAKGHCSNHTDDHHKDFFRIYGTQDGSWRAHSEFLVNQSRYKGLLKYGKNYKLWALKLREFGYATDPTYDKKLIGIIEIYELYKLDDL